KTATGGKSRKDGNSRRPAGADWGKELGPQALFEAELHRGPLTLDHGEDHGVAVAPVGPDALVAQRPLVARTKLFDGRLGVQIVDVGLQRHPNGAPVIEG